MLMLSKSQKCKKKKKNTQYFTQYFSDYSKISENPIMGEQQANKANLATSLKQESPCQDFYKTTVLLNL